MKQAEIEQLMRDGATLIEQEKQDSNWWFFVRPKGGKSIRIRCTQAWAITGSDNTTMTVDRSEGLYGHREWVWKA